MKTPSKPSRILASLLLAAALQPLHSHAASLLYQWEFDGASGTPTAGAGGMLAPVGTASFGATGVSGGSGDNALSVSNSYSGGTGSGNRAEATGDNVLTGIGTLGSFTITMWVNLTAGDFAGFPRLFLLGPTSNPDTGSNPGIAMSLNGGNIELKVNNSSTTTIPVAGINSGSAGTWHFLAFAYDGTAANPYFSSKHGGLYGSADDNAVLLTATTTSSVTVGGAAGLNTGAPTFLNPVGAAAIGTSATLSLGDRADTGRGLTGLIDDVRIYDDSLSIPELEAIRLEAVPEPSSLALSLLGLVGILHRRR